MAWNRLLPLLPSPPRMDLTHVKPLLVLYFLSGAPTFLPHSACLQHTEEGRGPWLVLVAGRGRP